MEMGPRRRGRIHCQKRTRSFSDAQSYRPVFTDQVSVAGLVADDQYFSAVDDVSPSFGNDVEDGIMGMAFQSIAELGQPPYFQSVSETIKLFSFRLY